MQGISLMRLSLATNAFIADNERVYRWRETRLVIGKYTISDVYKRVYRWRRTRLSLETNTVKTRVRYTLHLIGTVPSVQAHLKMHVGIIGGM